MTIMEPGIWPQRRALRGRKERRSDDTERGEMRHSRAGHYTGQTLGGPGAYMSQHSVDTDRGDAAGRAAPAAAARRVGHADAWSSRAADRVGPARAWRGRGRRSLVAPSLRNATSAHRARASHTVDRHPPLFSRGFFWRGRRRGRGAGQWAHAALPRPRGSVDSYLRAVY